MNAQSRQLEYEDLATFLSAAHSATGQAEFYEGRDGGRVAMDFLHAYILSSYRRLYARTLAAGLNHFNQALIIKGLLAAGAPADAEQRAEEGALIAAAMDALPPQRVYRLIRELRAERVNNRRTRAVIRGWLERRDRIALDALKYRPGLRAAARHAHLSLGGEVGRFVFRGPDSQRAWATPLLETYRRSRYAKEALYELPMTVAEGIAARRGIDRQSFLTGIRGRMTAAERLRTQAEAEVPTDLGKAPLTRLALYLLGLSLAERGERRRELEAALAASARRVRGGPGGRVAAVLDRSWSSRGSREKRRRPLAVALAVSALLRSSAAEYRAFWSVPSSDELLVYPRGQTDLAGPLLEALAWGAELVVVVSDGFENDPPGAASEVLRIWRERCEGAQQVRVVHLNPVFESERYRPRCLGPDVPMLGIRDAEELPELIVRARFMAGSAGGDELAALEDYLERRAQRMIARHRARLAGLAAAGGG